uniref:Uncharacterized protein n=1 Tax=Lepeophtheirus salmonis TaxID=72036 RepID=A0A0K2SWM1_LEPSM
MLLPIKVCDSEF